MFENFKARREINRTLKLWGSDYKHMTHSDFAVVMMTKYLVRQRMINQGSSILKSAYACADCAIAAVVVLVDSDDSNTIFPSSMYDKLLLALYHNYIGIPKEKLRIGIKHRRAFLKE